MKSNAVACFVEYDEMARLLPPRVDEPGPLRPGSTVRPNLPATADEPSVALPSV